MGGQELHHASATHSFCHVRCARPHCDFNHSAVSPLLSVPPRWPQCCLRLTSKRHSGDAGTNGIRIRSTLINRAIDLNLESKTAQRAPRRDLSAISHFEEVRVILWINSPEQHY